MSAVKIPKEALDIALVLGSRIVVCFLELRIADEGLAVLAPIFRLVELL